MKTIRNLTICLLMTAAFFTAGLFRLRADGNSTAARTEITTVYEWVSDDPEDYEWIIDKEGVPTQVWIVDQEAREKISHMERVHHEAVTHEEVVEDTREVFVFREITMTMGTIDYVEHVFYDLTPAQIDHYLSLPTYALYDRYEEAYEKTVTVIDEEAYDQEEEVIDQYPREEQGHYETVMEGEEGHFEMKEGVVPGEHEGHYEAHTYQRQGG